MNLARRAVLSLVGGGLVVLSFYLPGHFIAGRPVTPTIRVVPFLLKLEYFRFTDNPSGELFDRVSVARKSDGTTVQSGDLMQQHVSFQTRKITYPSGKVVIFWDSIAAKSTFPVSSAAEASVVIQRLTDPRPNCTDPGQIFLGFELLLGRRVAYTKTALPGGRVGFKWKDPQLACESLQSRLEEVQPDGSSRLLTEERPVSLSLEDASPEISALFDEGISYSEMKPSQCAHKLWERLGITWPSEFDPAYSHEDAAYLKRNASPADAGSQRP